MKVKIKEGIKQTGQWWDIYSGSNVSFDVKVRQEVDADWFQVLDGQWKGRIILQKDCEIVLDEENYSELKAKNDELLAQIRDLEMDLAEVIDTLETERSMYMHKFKEGDEVYFMHNNRISKGAVIKVKLNNAEYKVLIDHPYRLISNFLVNNTILFATKEELILSLQKEE